MAIAIQSHGLFFAESLGKDMAGKVFKVVESHGAPPGAHVIAMFFLTWPAVYFLPRYLGHIKQWSKEPVFVFCASWFISVFLIFELTSTKLPHYTLPAYPAIAIMLAAAAGRVDAGRYYLGWLFVVFVPVILGCVMFVVTIVWALQPQIALLILSSVVAFSGFGAWAIDVFYQKKHNRLVTHIETGRVGRTLVLLICLSIFVQFSVYQIFAPRMAPLWISSQLQKATKQLQTSCPGDVAIIGYGEPSAVFLMGTETKLIRVDELNTFQGLVFINIMDVPENFVVHDTMVSVAMSPITGVNLNGGDPVHVEAWCAR